MTPMPGVVIVIAGEETDFVESATEVAVTVTVPPVGRANGAV